VFEHLVEKVDLYILVWNLNLHSSQFLSLENTVIYNVGT